MATVSTSTASNSFTNAFGYPNNTMMDLDVTTGVLWIVFKDQSNRGAIYSSSDNGGSWSFEANFTVAGATLEDICDMRIDAAGDNIHMILLVNNGSAEEGRYKRCPIGGTASAPTVDTSTGATLFTGPNGTLQSVELTGCLTPVKNPDGSFHILIAFAQHGTGTSGISLYAITVRNDAAQTTFSNYAIIGPTRSYKVSGDDGAISCTMDLEHNGDGITTNTPNIWVTWLTFTTLYSVRCTWKGYKSGWQTPTKAATVATGRVSERDAFGRWDGTRFVIISLNPSNQAQMQVYERNASNTSNVASRTSPSHPLGSINNAKLFSYNYVTKDIRLFVHITGQAIYYVDYFRGTNTWGSWTSTGWTQPVSSEWGLRRGTYLTGQYDAYLETGAGSPWTISNQIQAVNFAPTAPTWITGTPGTVITNGAAFDVLANLTLDWDHHDPNVTDTQSAYALKRKIGAATAEWWRASDSTWQLAETFNTTGTTSVILTPAQWVGAGGAADAAHVYTVSTKDSGTPTLQSPYSIGLSLVPSTRVNPTITAPTVNQILNVANVPVTWTVSEQRQWRIQVKPTIVADAFGRTASSGWAAADYGGTWVCTTGGSAADFSVSSGTGRMSHAANSVAHTAALTGVIADDVNIYVGTVLVPAVSTGGSAEWGIQARVIDTNNFVDARIFFTVGGGPQIIVRSKLAGVETISAFVIPGGITNNGPVSLRFVADGPMLYGRIWNPSNSEPDEWQVTCEATLLSSGSIAVLTTLPGTNSNTKPYVFQTDNILISDASLVSYDSGFVTDSVPLSPVTTAFTVPTVLPDGYAGLVTLQTRNAEGLASTVQTVPFTIDFVEPVAPTVSVLAANPAGGGMNVAVTQVAAAGSQPATHQLDIWRRKVVPGTVLGVNANPFFEVDASDWTNSGYSTVARSTSQFHSGVASILLTPNGSSATPKVQTTALYPTVAGSLWEFRGWLRSTTANKIVRVYIDWYDASPTLISSAVHDFTPTATAWIYATLQAAAPVAATQARIAIGQLATPAAGDTLFGDELEFLPANGDTGIRVAANVVSGTTYLDWRAVTGIDYEYRGYAEATNGTAVYGPWTD